MSDPAPRSRWLDRIERVGNSLPDPTTLFLLGTLAVIALSQVAVAAGWAVSKGVANAETGALERVAIEPVGLLSSDGLFWLLDSLVDNFMAFPPLGVVLVGMLGIGLAEKSGFIGALLKAVLLAVPSRLLTPTIFFVGVLSSMGLDAGYVVLPPLAAALYKAVGRSPAVGLGAVFAGVSAGFSANIMVTSLDPMLAEFSTASAHLIDDAYAVSARANLHFIRVSTILLTLVGWAVTAWWVEPRYANKSPEDGGPVPVSSDELAQQRLTAVEGRALRLATAAALATGLVFAAATVLPGAPLHGTSGSFPRWVAVIVPLLFIGFLVPGLVYGFATGRLGNDRDVAKMFGETMSDMGPYIVLAFFAAQFIACFAQSNLGVMLAITGGDLLSRADLPVAGLMVGFVGTVMLGNLFIGSMSAKYAFFAPVFIPMFMQVGVSPELTQAAYRVGDSVTNVITPLNPYVVILLVFLQRYIPRAGIGTLVALMLPYAMAFALAWTVLLVVWIQLGIPLGPEGPLSYSP